MGIGNCKNWWLYLQSSFVGGIFCIRALDRISISGHRRPCGDGAMGRTDLAIYSRCRNLYRWCSTSADYVY